jgi:predicted dithiol-disulfide oxidoreductase (DUF899 family)
MDLPDVVSQREWEAALERLRATEKQATRARDALAAERRRLSYTRMLWMGLRKRAAYLPGC